MLVSATRSTKRETTAGDAGAAERVELVCWAGGEVGGFRFVCEGLAGGVLGFAVGRNNSDLTLSRSKTAIDKFLKTLRSDRPDNVSGRIRVVEIHNRSFCRARAETPNY